jgi:hypothetical protein
MPQIISKGQLALMEQRFERFGQNLTTLPSSKWADLITEFQDWVIWVALVLTTHLPRAYAF